jgi:hypothetical protein
MMAPIAVVWRVVLAVLERASRGWKVGWSAMAGEWGVYVVLRALSTVDEVAPMDELGLARKTR